MDLTKPRNLTFFVSVSEFWENWYVIGENDAGADEEFKFVYYNGKTRQNTYEGAFVYSRSKTLEPESMKKVYQIAKNAGNHRVYFSSFIEDNEALDPARP